MQTIKERLTAAMNEKENLLNEETHDINSYVWKGPKEELNGQKFQDEIKLVDASDSQLLEFYAHCKSMLYSKDPGNPGRYVLIDQIREDRKKCNAELFMRYVTGVYKPSQDRPKVTRSMFFEDLRNFLSRNTATFPSNLWAETPISAFIEVPEVEFSRLTLDILYQAADEKLGIFVRKPITLNFLTKLGIWLESDEMRDLTERDEKTGKKRDYLDVIKERLMLKPTIRLKAVQGGLSYAQFRAMTKLHTGSFTSLTTEQLVTLRDRVLFRLEDTCVDHINFWEGKIKELEEVAKTRGWSF